MATLEQQLATLIVALGTDYKNVWAKIGTGALNTTAQNLVAAINEVKTTADSAVAGTAPDGSTTVKGIVRLTTDSEALALSASDIALTPHGLGAVRGAVNGLAGLDSGGKVPAAQLPSYVDDVLEYANLGAFPGTGVAGVLYIALDTNLEYRWSGSTYVEISKSPGSTDAVPEGATNLYYTAARADARADARITARIGDENTDLAALYATAKS
jgi:hypothetical protein